MIGTKARVANVATLHLTDGREVLLSYGVPVAAFAPPHGTFYTTRKFSQTTTGHLRTYLKSRDTLGTPLADAEFCALVAPIDPKR